MLLELLHRTNQPLRYLPLNWKDSSLYWSLLLGLLGNNIGLWLFLVWLCFFYLCLVKIRLLCLVFMNFCRFFVVLWFLWILFMLKNRHILTGLNVLVKKETVLWSEVRLLVIDDAHKVVDQASTIIEILRIMLIFIGTVSLSFIIAVQFLWHVLLLFLFCEYFLKFKREDVLLQFYHLEQLLSHAFYRPHVILFTLDGCWILS